MSSSVLPRRLELSAVVELLKPVTWFASVWAFICGTVSAGVSFDGRWGEFALGTLLCGPLVCATSQAINDWHDRHVDAINEPNRPIPSGRIPGEWGLYIAMVWAALSLLVAARFGAWGLYATAAGLFFAWAYSAPPLRLKRNGWWGNAAVAVCYEGLPWITGAAIMAGGAPDWRILVVAGLYSFGAHGIMTLNDFKSIEGDRRMGLGSLPARLGAERAALVACAMMAAPQPVVIALLLAWGQAWAAALILVTLVAQLVCMRRMLRDPKALAPWYNATGVSLYVLGMLATAFALRALVQP
ncbi:MAG: chlorophyll synthase ChlG [Pseudomonadota bacterium]